MQKLGHSDVGVGIRRTTGSWVALLAAALLFGACGQAKAALDTNSTAVLNYVGPLWVAFYNSSDISGFSLPTSSSITINENPDVDITDPTGTLDRDGVFSFHATFSGGVQTGGTLLEQVDTSVAQDGSQLSTIFSSSTLTDFGVIPSTPDYYFAFQNGSNPNNIIGGYILGSDVKTFAITVPEPSSALPVALLVVGLMSTRYSRGFRKAV